MLPGWRPSCLRKVEKSKGGKVPRDMLFLSWQDYGEEVMTIAKIEWKEVGK